MKASYITFLFLLLLLSCKEDSGVTEVYGYSIPVGATEQTDGAAEVRRLIESGRQAVDSIKAPVIGVAAKRLTLSSPESPLMNFAADALLMMARRESNEAVDIAVTNKGGLRSEIDEGAITFGDIYNVFPFENTLTLLTLDGDGLLKLFAEIAKEGGEAISGARIMMTGDGKLVAATVAGKAVDPNKRYRIATSDYLSQGNDGLTTLALGSDKKNYTVTIRDMMIEYVATLHKQGVAVDACNDGRITIVGE